MSETLADALAAERRRLIDRYGESAVDEIENFARRSDVESKRLRAALVAMVAKWAPHSGSCCTFDTYGRVIVTEESCRCGRIEKRARAALIAS